MFTLRFILADLFTLDILDFVTGVVIVKKFAYSFKSHLVSTSVGSAVHWG